VSKDNKNNNNNNNNNNIIIITKENSQWKSKTLFKCLEIHLSRDNNNNNKNNNKNNENNNEDNNNKGFTCAVWKSVDERCLIYLLLTFFKKCFF
jgi:hypothetical protein